MSLFSNPVVEVQETELSEQEFMSLFGSKPSSNQFDSETQNAIALEQAVRSIEGSLN